MSSTNQLKHKSSKYDDLQFNPKHKKPLASWMNGLKTRLSAHTTLATKYDRKDKTMNTISVIITGLTSSAIFASNSGSVSGSMSVNQLISQFAGVLAVISTILQSVHKSMQYSNLAEQHKFAVKQLTKLKFRFEIIVGDNCEDDGEVNFNNLTEWTREYQAVLESAPIIPQTIFQRKYVYGVCQCVLKFEYATFNAS